jgi:perosamine synthetase
MIPITKPYMDEAEAQAAASAIRTGWIAQGPLVAQFEAAFAARVGAAHAVAVSSCTAALHLALICAEIGPGDEVVVPSLTFIATANAVRHVGATPVFAEIDHQTYNLTAETVRAALTPRTKAIIVVDQIGLPADLDPILELAEHRGLSIVEDAAPTVGATYRHRPVGSLGPTTCFSFHPRKSISCGEGGMITTQSAALAARARVLRSHGASVSDLARHQANAVVIEQYSELGYNYRMTDIQAAIGLEQLKKLDCILSERRRLAARYGALLADIPGVTPPYVPDWSTHTYQSYAVRLDPAQTPSRDAVMARMLQLGVATRRGIMAIHEESLYRTSGCHLPITEAATRETMLLPIFTTLTDTEQDTVIAALRKALA